MGVYNYTAAELMDNLDNDNGIKVPEVEVELTTGKNIYKIYSNEETDFPLAYNNIDNIDVRSFFSNLRR